MSLNKSAVQYTVHRYNHPKEITSYITFRSRSKSPMKPSYFAMIWNEKNIMLRRTTPDIGDDPATELSFKQKWNMPIIAMARDSGFFRRQMKLSYTDPEGPDGKWEDVKLDLEQMASCGQAGFVYATSPDGNQSTAATCGWRRAPLNSSSNSDSSDDYILSDSQINNKLAYFQGSGEAESADFVGTVHIYSVDEYLAVKILLSLSMILEDARRTKEAEKLRIIRQSRPASTSDNVQLSLLAASASYVPTMSSYTDSSASACYSGTDCSSISYSSGCF